VRKLFRQRLLREEKGGTLVEFAIVGPTVVLLAVGLLQMGMLFYASATMRSAVGDGARMARLYRTPATATSYAGPTSTEICSRVTSRIRSMRNATITSLTLTKASNGTAHALSIAVNYSVALHFAFFSRTVPLSTSRQVYLSSEPSFGNPVVSCPV
jgi:Flp pilus assembly protein TadG